MKTGRSTFEARGRQTFEQKLEELDKLIVDFKRLSATYPEGIYEGTLMKLERERTELVNTLGRQQRKRYEK